MADNSANPKVVLKKKQIPALIEFCLDESIEFNVKQQSFPETDWEVELKLKDFRMAILVGMYLRENKMDIDGIDSQRYKKPASPKKSEEKAEPVKAEPSKVEKHKTESDDQQSPTLM